LPKKDIAEALLLLDGHESHYNAIHLLEIAVVNDVILLCFSSYTTYTSSPL